MNDNDSTIGRRDFMGIGAAAAASAILYSGLKVFGTEAIVKNAAVISLPKLPYPAHALAPYISERTIKIHYNQHHKSYYDIVAGYVKGILKQYSSDDLEGIILKSKSGILEEESLHAIAVLLYNHNIYWPSMKPGGGGKPNENFARRIDKAFGSYELFRKEFMEKAMTFETGWISLTRSNEALLLERTDYHNSPLLKGQNMLLTLDLWEHAYYLDYQADKQKYIEAYLDHLVNWEYGEARLKLFE